MIAITDDVGTSIIDDPNLRGHCASLDTGSIDMTETLVVRELAVRELDPKLGNLGGADGTRLGRLARLPLISRRSK